MADYHPLNPAEVTRRNNTVTQVYIYCDDTFQNGFDCGVVSPLDIDANSTVSRPRRQDGRSRWGSFLGSPLFSHLFADTYSGFEY